MHLNHSMRWAARSLAAALLVASAANASPTVSAASTSKAGVVAPDVVPIQGVTSGVPVPVTVTGGSGSTVKIDQTTPGTTNGVVVNSSALPTGAATSANQATSQTSLGAIATSTASLDTKQPAKGSATSANSSPVVIASDQAAVPVSLAAAATGGATAYSAIVPNNTTGVQIGAAGERTVYTMSAFNNAATIAYVKLYNKATAPTCGTDTPTWRGMIPGATGGSGYVFPLGATGVDFPLGLGICVTTGIADNDTGAPTASEYLLNVGYK